MAAKLCFLRLVIVVIFQYRKRSGDIGEDLMIFDRISDC
jgi:hypothetical protein